MDGPRSPLEIEILAEQVQALTRATEALEASLRVLETARPRAVGDPSPRLGQRDTESALAEAGERLWSLIVQREAMGIVTHDILYEVLKVPAAVRARAAHQVRRP